MKLIEFLTDVHETILINPANICGLQENRSLSNCTLLHMTGGLKLALWGTPDYIRHRLELGHFPGRCEVCPPHDYYNCTDPRHIFWNKKEEKK